MHNKRIKLVFCKALLVGLFTFQFFLYVFQGVGSSKTQPYLDDTYTRIVAQSTKVYVNDTVDLEVGIKNPINESVSVVVRIHVDNVDCFPSNESQVLLPPKNYYPSSEEVDFILIPSQSGTHPLEVQLWWNETKVDYKLLTLEVSTQVPPPDPTIFWPWLRINGIVWGLIYLIIALRFVNPAFQIVIEKENAKWLVFFMISFFYGIGALIMFSSLSQYASSIIPFIEEMQFFLGIAWALTVVSFGLTLLKRYDWSNRFSTFVLLFLLLSVAWDWLLFPQYPFPTWSPVAIILFSALVQALMEIGIKGAFERLKSLRKRKQKQ